MSVLIDSHCHLDFPAFDSIRVAELEECKQQGVQACVVPGVSRETWDRLERVVSASKALYAAYGLHPYFLEDHERSDIELLRERLESSNTVAVGEFGLDYFLPNLDRAEQQYFFEAQLDLARQLNLPVILHVRKAHDEVLRALRQFQLPRAGAIHAYSGSFQQAQQYIELGFKLGFGGAVTYDRANKLRNLVKELPLESLLLETDAPDMPPSFIEKGEPNRPHYLVGIAQQISELRGIAIEELSSVTSKTAATLFHLEYHQ